jgi:2-phospho-L-lactate guanylyltransferase
VVADVVVVTDDERAAATVRACGARTVPDAPDRGLNPALAHGALAAPVAALSSDLPALRPAELAAARSSSVTTTTSATTGQARAAATVSASSASTSSACTPPPAGPVSGRRRVLAAPSRFAGTTRDQRTGPM